MDPIEVRRPEALAVPTPPKTPQQTPLPPPRRIGVKIQDDDDYAPTVKVLNMKLASIQVLGCVTCQMEPEVTQLRIEIMAPKWN